MQRPSRSPAVAEDAAPKSKTDVADEHRLRRAKARVAELEEENASLRDALAQFGKLVARASAPAPATPHQRLALWSSRLPSPAPGMLHRLAGRGERYTSPEELATTLGKKPTSRSWNAGLTTLRRHGLIEFEGSAMRAIVSIWGR